MEVEEDYTSQNYTQSESIYIVDIENEVSLEEGMAKNRSLFNQSAVSRVDESTTQSHDVLKQENRETSPFSVSTSGKSFCYIYRFIVKSFSSCLTFSFSC